MTTIQDRIIKDFKEKFGKYKYLCRYSDDFKKGEWKNLDEVKQFLIQSIKEVEEETRKEERKNFNKHCDNCVLYETKQILSITNKEKQ